MTPYAKSEIALAPDIVQVKQDILALKRDLSSLIEKEGLLLATLIAGIGAVPGLLTADSDHRTKA